MIASIENIRLYLRVVFLFSGISKFIPDRRIIKDLFPQLPNVFWPVSGAWELAIVILLWQRQDFVATGMSYVFLGGALGASLFLKDRTRSTMAQKSYGLILIPAVVTLYAVVMLAQLRDYSLLIFFPGVLTGVLVALILVKAGKEKLKQKN